MNWSDDVAYVTLFDGTHGGGGMVVSVGPSRGLGGSEDQREFLSRERKARGEGHIEGTNQLGSTLMATRYFDRPLTINFQYYQ